MKDELKLITTFSASRRFCQQFGYLKGVCFVPLSDVESVFEFIKDELVDPEILPLYEYFEKYYIGEKKQGSERRSIAMFPKARWNVYKRVLESRGRSDNEIEAWHGVFGFGIGKHPTSNKLAKHLQKEQARTDRTKVHISLGRTKPRDAKGRKRDLNDIEVLNLVKSFTTDCKQDGKINKKALHEWLDLLEVQLLSDSNKIITSNAITVIESVVKGAR
jgi:hypothetical protein